MITRADVVKEAREWIDTPFEHQHRVKGALVDCIGLIIGISRNLGLVPADFNFTSYARAPDGKTFIDGCEAHMGGRVSLDKLLPGHACVFRFGTMPQHIGVVGEYIHQPRDPEEPRILSIIHAYSEAKPKGRVIETRLLRTKTMAPIMGYRFPGVED